jgi:hypothetical protein
MKIQEAKMENEASFETVNQSAKDYIKSISDEMYDCVELCMQCHRECEEIIPHCLEKGGKHASREHIMLLLSCADICRATAHSIMWDSEFHTKICSVCAEICASCALDCQQMTDDPKMLECADICRRCSQECQKLAMLE